MLQGPAPGLKLQAKDYTSNLSATDRNWFYKNPDGSHNPTGDGAFPSVEYDGSRSFQIDRVAFVRGNNIVIDVTFKNQSTITATGTMKVYEARIKYPGNQGTASLATPSNESYTIPAGGTKVFTWTFSSVPNHVALGDLEIRAEARGNLGFQLPGEPDASSWGGTGWQVWEKVYLTYTSPVNHQSTPWTEMLDYSCKWAFGKTSQVDVVHDQTFGLFFGNPTGSGWSDLLAYNLGLGAGTNWVQLDTNEFKLSSFWKHRFNEEGSSPGIQRGNCVDTASLLSLFMQSQGIEASLLELSMDSERSAYVTNEFCPIGSDPEVSGNQIRTAFGWHMVTVQGSNVYDSSAGPRFDLNGNLWKKPLLNATMPDFWQKTVGNPVSSAYGHAYRAWLPGDSLDYYPVSNGWWWVATPDPNYGPASTPYVSITKQFYGIK